MKGLNTTGTNMGGLCTTAVAQEVLLCVSEHSMWIFLSEDLMKETVRKCDVPRCITPQCKLPAY